MELLPRIFGVRARKKSPRRLATTGGFEAGEGIRTLDIHLGKVTLYH